jgi:L-ascorbate oxidase
MEAAMREVALVLALPLLGSGALAQTSPRFFVNPPELQPVQAPRLLDALIRLRPPTGGPAQQEVSYDLKVSVADTTIYNPNTGKSDPVHLRAYNGKLIAPTITVEPSQTVRILLENDLQVESEAACPPPQAQNHTVPSCFSTTNLHYHGLHVSPTGNSDNVLLQVAPGQHFAYEINIPADHPAGTFWYHSHRHGSTALQVASGMEGPLIVRGRRSLSQRATYGSADIDTILRKSTGAPLDEQILLFQQIPYACFVQNAGADTNTILTSDPSGHNGAGFPWTCPTDASGNTRPGQVESYSTQFAVPAWPASGRYTLVTGQVQPTFGAISGSGTPIHAGEVQRWRMIHGGVRDTIDMEIIAAPNVDPNDPEPVGAQAQADWIAQYCTGGVIQQWEFALDGLTRRTPQIRTVNALQPAYRSDILLTFPQAGVYCVLDKAAAAGSTINPGQTAKVDRLLARVVVDAGTPVNGSQTDYILSQILDANSGAIPDDVVQQLRGGDLSAFDPNPDLSQSAAVQTRPIAFNIVPNPDAPTTPRFEINNAIYNPVRVDFRPVVDTVEDWDITSKLATHVFHIHVNPFQIITITDPQGRVLTNEPGCDQAAPGDDQYCGLTGTVRDTIFIKSNYHVLIRTAYSRYIGSFVLHCHILDHEDQGMMQNVEIMPQGGTGGLEVTPNASAEHRAH